MPHRSGLASAATQRVSYGRFHPVARNVRPGRDDPVDDRRNRRAPSPAGPSARQKKTAGAPA